jgi:hypothetical protein
MAREEGGAHPRQASPAVGSIGKKRRWLHVAHVSVAAAVRRLGQKTTRSTLVLPSSAVIRRARIGR